MPTPRLAPRQVTRQPTHLQDRRTKPAARATTASMIAPRLHTLHLTTGKTSAPHQSLQLTTRHPEGIRQHLERRQYILQWTTRHQPVQHNAAAVQVVKSCTRRPAPRTHQSMPVLHRRRSIKSISGGSLEAQYIILYRHHLLVSLHQHHPVTLLNRERGL